MSDDSDDLRGAIQNAWDSGSKEPEPAPSVTETSAVEPSPAPAAAPAEVAATETPEGDQPRDEHGRFAPKTPDTAPADSTKPEAAAAPAPPAEDQPKMDTPGKPPVAPPKAWSDAAKVKWQRLPREVQEELLKVDQGGRFGSLGEVIAPYQQRFALKGQTPEQAVGALVAAWDGLENPQTRVNTLVWLAQSYGVDLAQFAPPASGNGQAGPAPNGAAEQEYVDPQVAQLRDELSGLRQQLNQFGNSWQQQTAWQDEQRRSTIANEVQGFRADPAHRHFDIVEEDVANLLRIDPRLDLKDAYDRAVWANPTLREDSIAERMEAESKKRADEEAQRTARARAASGSVTGSPTPGATVSDQPDLNLRATLERAYAEAVRAS